MPESDISDYAMEGDDSFGQSCATENNLDVSVSVATVHMAQLMGDKDNLPVHSLPHIAASAWR